MPPAGSLRGDSRTASGLLFGVGLGFPDCSKSRFESAIRAASASKIANWLGVLRRTPALNWGRGVDDRIAVPDHRWIGLRCDSFAGALGVPGSGAGAANAHPKHAPHRAPSPIGSAMKPLLSLGTIVLAIAAAKMPAAAAWCITQDAGFVPVCPPTAPPVEQPKSRPVHVAKRQHRIDTDEKAPPAKPPPALPPRIDTEAALHAPAGASLVGTGQSEISKPTQESARRAPNSVDE